jgi:small subunit ribosomal protein S9
MARKKDDSNKPEVKVEKKPARGKKAEVAASDAAPAPVAPVLASVEVPQGPVERKPKIDAKGRSYGTGRRKDAAARVWVKRGSGKVIVNGRDQSIYFARHTHRLVVNQPFLVVNAVGHYDVIATVKGGGLSGQAGAVRHGISRALQNFDPALRPPLKKAGLLTRDPRQVERKKVGLHGARRMKQWAKR